MLKEGDKVLINKHEYTLGAKLGGGKEGSVFDVVEKSNAVVKIINDRVMSESQRNEAYSHLKWLCDLRHRSDREFLRNCMVLPMALLDDQLGYVMRKATDYELLDKYVIPPEKDEEFDSWYKEKYPLKKRYQIIVNLFDTLREIHLAGLIFTDLSPNNIMVHKQRNSFVFIDTDNIRKRTDSYLSVLGTPGYMAPEVYRKPDAKLAKENNIDPKILSNSGRITTESDIFSAAVIAFQLLTLWHPFIGDEIEEGTPDDETRALEIKTDYIFKAGTSNTSTYALVPQFQDLTTPEIRHLFERTFEDGKMFPALRPTAEEFYEAFLNAMDMIVECPHCGYQRIYVPGEENVCINCQNLFEKQIVLNIYTTYKRISRAGVINNIGSHKDYDVEELHMDFTNANGTWKKKENFFLTGRVLLTPGMDNAKVLYARHFDTNTDRRTQYLQLMIDDLGRNAKITVIKQLFPDVYLARNKDGEYYGDMENGQPFPLDEYSFVLNRRDHGTGEIKSVGKFVKE